VLALIGDKWTPIVLYCLSGGVRRFGELYRHIPGISKKMLTQVLRNLERDGLVERTVYPEVTPKTDYVLSALGVQVHKPIALLCRWALQNTQVLDRVDRHSRTKGKRVG
jgi:DNA-binding HxlR family transcriptional regulator